MQDAVDDLSLVVQLDPANLDAHNLLHQVRDEMHAEPRHMYSSAIGGLYA